MVVVNFSFGCLLRSFNYSSSGHSSWWELNLRALEQCFSNWVFEFFFFGGWGGGGVVVVSLIGFGIPFYQRDNYESVCVGVEVGWGEKGSSFDRQVAD